MFKILSSLFFVSPIFSQELNEHEIGGEYKFGVNENPCLTYEQRNSIKEN